MTNTHRWLIALTVTMLAIVEVLDITIVAVALINLKGALSATPSEITWTITVYVVAAAIFMPLTGYLSKRFGRRRLLFWSALGFGGASLMCGLSTTLAQIVIFRALQGACGAILPSLAQSTMLSTFPGKESNKAMSIFGMGIMLGPVMGPVLGGFIVEHMGWQWIFLINVPICLVAAVLTLLYIPKTEPSAPIKNDWLGLGLLAMGVGALQFVLDKGNEDGWFSAHSIQAACVISVLALVIFVARGWHKPDHVVNFTVLKDRNYTVSCVVMLLYCGVFLGGYSWMPLWLEVFMHYPPQTVGLLLLSRGVTLFVAMGLSPILLRFIEARCLVALSCVLYSIGAFVVSGFDLQQGPEALLLPNIVQGFAAGLFFVPLTSLAYQTLSPLLLDTASGLFNFFRCLGSSIGVAVFTTIMVREAQVAWSSLAVHVNSMNPQLQQWVAVQHTTLQNPSVYPQLAETLIRQSNTIAFNDANVSFAVLSLLIIPLLFLIQKKTSYESGGMVH